jgi:hypothetical protein
MSQEQVAPLSVEDAVRAAKKALPTFLGGDAPKNVRVEEVVPDDENGQWHITLSYLEDALPLPLHPAIKALRGVLDTEPPRERVLKVVKVDAVTGKALGMVIRAIP